MGISESGWFFSIILAHPMLLSRLRVPGPPGPLSPGMGFVSCLCGSRGQDENAWATFFLLPLSVAFSLLNTSVQRWLGLIDGLEVRTGTLPASGRAAGEASECPFGCCCPGFCSSASAGRTFKELSPPVLFLYREGSRGPGE